MMPIEMPPGSRDEPSAAPAFDEMLGRHRRALHLFCYRMVASYTDAEDLTQDAMMRAWKARDTYDAATAEIGFRRWLYRIASNACLDFLKSSARKMAANAESFAEVPWLQPYPQHMLDDDVAGKETIALGYLADPDAACSTTRRICLARCARLVGSGGCGCARHHRCCRQQRTAART